MRPATRALIGLWITVLGSLAAAGAVLSALGPPGRRHQPAHPISERPAQVGLVADPDPLLLEPAPDFPGRFLPRRAASGSATPAERYRSRAATAASGPRVAVLLEGIGLSDEASRIAIASLPPSVSLAVSPYAAGLDASASPTLLTEARHIGHELWLSLPMEAGETGADEGSHALRHDSDRASNATALEWALSRFGGYVGVTDAVSTMSGDAFGTGSDFSLVADALRERGLLFVGTAPSRDGSALPPPATSQEAQVVIDGEADRSVVASALRHLEELAARSGTPVLAVVGPATPVLVATLREWSAGLAARHVSLVPASTSMPGNGAEPR